MTGPITNQTLRVSRGPYGLHAELTPGSGPPVVLMHGFPDSTHLYDRLVPHLAGRRPIVRFDFLGLGALGQAGRLSVHGHQPGGRPGRRRRRAR
jgi:pimeloyl-ACP methyl ester carboxylesterase